MPTTDTLEGLRHATVCHLLLIDGISTGFSDDSILVSGDYTGNGHTIRPWLDTDGLELPEALDLRSGKLDEMSATFTLRDLSDESGAVQTLAALFAAEDSGEEPLAASVYPGDNLLARTELHDKHVGTERIGSSGERHRFPCILGFQVGDMHIGQDQELPQHRPAPVSDNPIVWRGRRCAFYRVYIDTDGSRRALAESRLLWWGTIADQGTVSGREWRIEALGQQSWLQKELGMLTQRQPVYAIGLTDLSSAAGQDETKIGLSFRLLGAAFVDDEDYGDRDFVDSITGTTPLDIIGDIVTAIDTGVAVSGTDGAFEDANNRTVLLDSTGAFSIHTDEDSNNRATMRITLHQKVWAAIGYDPIGQRNEEQGSEYYVKFAYYDGDGEGEIPSVPAYNGEAPGAGYITATIDTVSPGDPVDGDNSGLPRIYKPRYPGGVSALLAGLNDGEGQLVDLGDGFGSTIIYARGQLSRPIASDPDDPASAYPIGAGVNRMGYFLFYGKRRFAGGKEFDEYQVGECHWRAGSATQQGIIQTSQVVVKRWMNPREFGYDTKKLSSDWVIRTNADDELRVKAVPILTLSYNASALEEAHVVIERLLRSTGTSTGWSGYADEDPTLDGGDNDSAGVVRRDGEVADLGLRIPDSMVQNILQFGLVAQALPSGLGDVKVAFSPGTPADEILESLMRPLGWAWSLRGAAYGIFNPYQTPAPDEIDVVLTWANKSGGIASMRESLVGQELRAFAPIDRFELDYSWAPHLDRYRLKTATDSKDVGRRYRSGGFVEKHPGRFMRYDSGWYERARQLGEWWSRRHFFVRQWPYMGREPRHVGEFVRFTDPRGVNPAGTYGITGMIGLIVGVTHVARPGDFEPFSRLDILVYADSATTPRLHAFSARGFGIDTDNDRIYVENNWLGFSQPSYAGDASFFITPTFPGVTIASADCDISWMQWNGYQWLTPITGYQVTGTGSDMNGTYLQLDGTIAATDYFHKMDTIVFLAPRDGTQTAQWVLDHYGVVTSEAGTFTGPTDGFNWEDL